MCALAGRAGATECGDLRLQAAHLKATAAVEEQLASTITDATKPKHQQAAKEAAASLKSVEKKVAQACAPRTVSIAALPLAYIAVPPGNGSRLGIEPGEKWGLTVTTLAGAKHGIVFADPVVVAAPDSARWESEAKGDEHLYVVMAVDAQLTVEEPTPGRGSWRIELKGDPVVAPASRLHQCATSGGGKLPQHACQALVAIEPLDRHPGALPQRGRGVLLGEWQYGDGSGVELLDELSETTASAPPPRLDLMLELSAPIPGVSEGKRLPVTLELNRKRGAAGSVLKLAQECGDDEKCAAEWFAVDVWYDRMFAVPFLKRRTLPAGVTRLSGQITDRLGKPTVGQRVQAVAGERRVMTITDRDGKYRFEGLPPGEVSVAAVGKKLGTKPRNDYVRTMQLGVLGTTAPKILVNRLFE